MPFRRIRISLRCALGPTIRHDCPSTDGWRCRPSSRPESVCCLHHLSPLPSPVQVMRKNLSESYEKNTYLEGQYLRLMKEHAALKEELTKAKQELQRSTQHVCGQRRSDVFFNFLLLLLSHCSHSCNATMKCARRGFLPTLDLMRCI
jgi:hypothetical protein